jgi:hypothetical protein
MHLLGTDVQQLPRLDAVEHPARVDDVTKACGCLVVGPCATREELVNFSRRKVFEVKGHLANRIEADWFLTHEPRTSRQRLQAATVSKIEKEYHPSSKSECVSHGYPWTKRKRCSVRVEMSSMVH